MPIACVFALDGLGGEEVSVDPSRGSRQGDGVFAPHLRAYRHPGPDQRRQEPRDDDYDLFFAVRPHKGADVIRPSPADLERDVVATQEELRVFPAVRQSALNDVELDAAVVSLLE